jgi:CDP-glycerol glycerophosphotransferase (TagB/SpsB family)
MIRPKGYLLFDNLDGNSCENIDCFTLFEYLQLHGEKSCYLTQKNNTIASQKSRQKDIISFQSPLSLLTTLKLIPLVIQYKYIVTSHGRIHFILSRFWKQSPYCSYIHAQHGITWLKQSPLQHNLSSERYDKLVVSSQQEALFAQQFGWEARNLITSGLFRFDKLVSSSNRRERAILIMFTWRSTFDRTEEQFTTIGNTTYGKRIRSLLENEGLVELCSENSIRLFFAKHHYGEDFGSGEIVLPDYITNIPTTNLSDFIRRCDLLITDYSSVAFDFFFQDKPVIFYHLDQHDNMLCEKDKKEQLFVSSRDSSLFNICLEESEVLNLLKKYINNFSLETEKLEKARSFFSNKGKACETFVNFCEGSLTIQQE